MTFKTKNFQISKKEFWACLLNYLAEELFLQGQLSVSEFIPDDIQEQNGDTKENGSRSPTIELESEDGWEEDPNCFEMIHSRFAPSRRLKDGFFNEEIAVSIDFSAYIDFFVCSSRL